METLLLIVVVGVLVFGGWSLFFKKEVVKPTTQTLRGGSSPSEVPTRHPDGSVTPPTEGENVK